MHVGHRYKVLLGLVLHKEGLQVVYVTVAVEYLAFAVLNIFLYVERNGLRQAEIFHIVGDGDAQLLAQCEEVV